jgi:hypothetical protein
MSAPQSFRLSLAILSLLAIGRAQGSTWIVDTANGTGTHFVDLQAALAAPQVLDGDVLVVRAGTYTNFGGFSTSKGVTILGVGSPRMSGGLSVTLTVTNLGAGRRFVMEGMTIDYMWPANGITLANNVGHVHLDEVVIRGNGNDYSTVSNSLTIAASALVTLNGCIVGAGGIRSSGGELVIANSRVQGSAARPWLVAGYRASRPALELAGGTVWLAQVTAVGGDGSAVSPAQPPSPAILGSGSIVLAGDSRSLLSAGTMVAATSAIVLHSGALEIDPRVVLNSYGSAPPISGNATVTTVPLAYLAGTGAAPTRTIALEVTSAPNDVVMLAASLPGVPVTLPFGKTHLDFASLLPLVNAVQGPSGRLGMQVPVPNMPELLGLLLVTQAANAQSGTGVLRLTNPVFFALN